MRKACLTVTFLFVAGIMGTIFIPNSASATTGEYQLAAVTKKKTCVTKKVNGKTKKVCARIKVKTNKTNGIVEKKETPSAKTPTVDTITKSDGVTGKGLYRFPSYAKLSKNSLKPEYIDSFDDEGWGMRAFTKDVPSLKKIAFPIAPYMSVKSAGYFGVAQTSAFQTGYSALTQESTKKENADAPELNIGRIDFTEIPAKTAEDKAMTVQQVAESFFAVKKTSLQTTGATKVYCPVVEPYYETKTIGKNEFAIMSWYCVPKGSTQIAWVDSPYLFLKSSTTGNVFAMFVQNKNSGWKLGQTSDVGFAKTMSVGFLEQLMGKIEFK